MSSEIVLDSELIKVLGIEVLLVGLSLVFSARIGKYYFLRILTSVESHSFAISPKLIQIAKILVGSSISTIDIGLINRGVIDLLSGEVVAINYRDGISGLNKIDVRDNKGEITTLKQKKTVSQEINKFSFNTWIYSILSNISPEFKTFILIGDLDLTNREKIISVENLNIYSEQIISSLNFCQPINVILNRITGEIKVLQIKSDPYKESKSNLFSRSIDIKQEPTSYIPLPIDIEFFGNFTENQKLAFLQAAQKWGSIIHSNLSPAFIDGKRIEGISIKASALNLDGPRNQLARAGPTQLRRDSLLPVTGIMEFDSADLKLLEEDGRLFDVIVHEMAHVLGFGTLWESKKLLQDIGTHNPVFVGENAMREYAKLIGANQPIPVPIENSGNLGTRFNHWRESIFGHELMTGFINNTTNPLSIITVASLQDLGYSLNLKSKDVIEKVNQSKLQIGIETRESFSEACCHNCSEK